MGRPASVVGPSLAVPGSPGASSPPPCVGQGCCYTSGDLLAQSPSPPPAEIANRSLEARNPVADLDWTALGRDLPRSTYRDVRYVVDRLVAVALLLVLSPVLVVVAVAIRLDSPGPVFFRQARAGRFTTPFTIIKFRTMQTTAPRSSLKMSETDPRITRVGRFLRKTGLDELPQLLNVIGGDMALIGPRPEQLGLLPLYEEWQHERHLLKPGITGWWQIHHRDNVPMYLNIEKDIHYVRHMGPQLDACIALGTLAVLATPITGLFRSLRAPQPADVLISIATEETAS